MCWLLDLVLYYIPFSNGNFGDNKVVNFRPSMKFKFFGKEKFLSFIYPQSSFPSQAEMLLQGPLPLHCPQLSAISEHAHLPSHANPWGQCHMEVIKLEPNLLLKPHTFLRALPLLTVISTWNTLPVDIGLAAPLLHAGLCSNATSSEKLPGLRHWLPLSLFYPPALL